MIGVVIVALSRCDYEYMLYDFWQSPLSVQSVMGHVSVNVLTNQSTNGNVTSVIYMYSYDLRKRLSSYHLTCTDLKSNISGRPLRPALAANEDCWIISRPMLGILLDLKSNISGHPLKCWIISRPMLGDMAYVIRQ